MHYLWNYSFSSTSVNVTRVRDHVYTKSFIKKKKKKPHTRTKRAINSKSFLSFYNARTRIWIPWLLKNSRVSRVDVHIYDCEARFSDDRSRVPHVQKCPCAPNKSDIRTREPFNLKSLIFLSRPVWAARERKIERQRVRVGESPKRARESYKWKAPTAEPQSSQREPTYICVCYTCI